MIDTKEIEGRIERYRKRGDYEPIGSIAFECIDHIDAQAEENARLREALEYYAEGKHVDDHGVSLIIEYGTIARAALKPDTEEGES